MNDGFPTWQQQHSYLHASRSGLRLRRRASWGVLQNALLGSYLVSHRAVVQPSLPLTETSLHFQTPHILCSGGAAAWFISLLFSRRRHPAHKSKSSHRRQRRITVGFVSRHSASLASVWLWRCQTGIEGGLKEKRKGVDVETQLKSQDCYSGEEKIVENQIMHSCSRAEKPQTAPYWVIPLVQG